MFLDDLTVYLISSGDVDPSTPDRTDQLIEPMILESTTSDYAQLERCQRSLQAAYSHRWLLP